MRQAKLPLCTAWCKRPWTGLDSHKESKNKTVSKTIKKDAVELTHAQIKNYHEFQELIREYVEKNVKICDKLLEQSR
ncbi:MAG TPA: hypothetical protein P5214_06350 [Rectinema sp.]|jgi:hypothetical protein|nr:hypothetical protein [Rectinema sp.]